MRLRKEVELSTLDAEHVEAHEHVAETRRYDAFLSYARVDKAFVEALTRDLEARGKNVYVDRDDIPPGAAWRRHILRGIEASKAIVFVLSPASVASDVCADELAQALSVNKRIVPVVLRTVEPRGLPEHLTAPNWIWLREEDDPQAGRQALIDALELDEEWLDAHARLTMRAREWDDAGRDHSFLLRGSDLEAAIQWLARQGEHRESATPMQVQYILDSRQAARSRRRSAFIIGAAALVITAGLALFAWGERNEAVRQSKTAQSRELAAAANAQLDAAPALSMLLAVESARVARTSQATAALRTALSASRLDAQYGMPAVPVGPPALSPDGRYALQGGLDGAGRVVDLRDHTVAARLTVPGMPKAQVGSYDGGPDFGAAVSPDGRYAATVSFDGDVRVWDWRARRLVATLPDIGKVRVAFSPDGRTLVAGSTLWDWRRDRTRLLPAGAFVAFVAFDPSGRHVAGSAVTGETRVWDVRTFKTVAELGTPERDNGTTSIAFSPDGRDVVRGTRLGRAEVWDWRARRRLATLRPGGRDARAIFGSDGKTLLVGATDGKIRVLDWASGDVLAELRGHRGAVAGVALAADGRIVSSGVDRTIRRWSAGKPDVTLQDRPPLDVSSVDITPDGRFAVTGGTTAPAASGMPRRGVAVSDISTGRRVASFAEAPAAGGDYDPWMRVDVSRDGRFVAGASDSGVVHVWDWRAGREVGTLRHGRRFVGDAAFSPDGAIVATTTTDRGVYVWSWRDGRVLRRLAPAREMPAVPGRVDIAPRGDVLAVTEGVAVRVWDWRRGRVLARLSLPSGAADAVFDRTGNFVAVAGDDGVARVFDWRSARSIAELRGGSAITTVSFSPDGGLLLTGDRDATTVWDWRLEQRIVVLREPRKLASRPDAAIGAARFAPDPTTILTAGVDGRAHVFACEACAPLDELLALARRRATRQLSDGERRRYLHEGG